MTKYKVLTGMLVGCDEGDEVTEADFPPNIDFGHLVASGHLRIIPPPKPAAKKAAGKVVIPNG